MSKITTTREAFQHSIQNDRQGIVSENDAKKIVEVALQEIKTSRTPQATFEATQSIVHEAEKFLGKDKDAHQILQSFSSQGTSLLSSMLQANQTSDQVSTLSSVFSDLFTSISDVLGHSDFSFPEVKHVGKALTTGLEVATLLQDVHSKDGWNVEAVVEKATGPLAQKLWNQGLDFLNSGLKKLANTPEIEASLDEMFVNIRSLSNTLFAHSDQIKALFVESSLVAPQNETQENVLVLRPNDSSSIVMSVPHPL